VPLLIKSPDNLKVPTDVEVKDVPGEMVIPLSISNITFCPLPTVILSLLSFHTKELETLIVFPAVTASPTISCPDPFLVKL